MIRIAKSSDAARLLEIYRPYVEDTSVSFETICPTLDEFEQRIQNTLIKFPWIVFEMENKIVGYAYGSEHRSRCAYGWSVDSTVYVDNKFHRKKIGYQLYQKLFSYLKEQGFYNVFAGVAVPNNASEGLHTSLGFREIGVYRKVGYKFNKWHDVKWFQLELRSDGIPGLPTPFKNRDRV